MIINHKIKNILSNKIVLYPTITQIFTALIPLIFFRYIFQGYTSIETIQVELLFVINAFCSVITNWSSTLFLSRIYTRLAKSGSISTILFNRLLTAIVILIISNFIQKYTLLLPESKEFSIALLFIILSQVIDPAWYYIGQKRLHIPQVQLMCQYCLALLLCYQGIPILFSIGTAWLIVCIIYFIPVVPKIKFGPVRFTLSKKIFRRFAYPTLSEVSTSLFSKLDVLYASQILEPDTAVVYILLRKHVLAVQSIIFASIRMLYLERDQQKLSDIQSLLRIYVTFVCAFGAFIIYYSISILFNYNMLLVDIVSLIIFITGTPIGYVKVRTQLQDVYAKGHYGFDLIATFAVFILYILTINAISLTFTNSLALFVFARISCDLSYITFTYFHKKQVL